jgi:hypothetical protein
MIYKVQMNNESEIYMEPIKFNQLIGYLYSPAVKNLPVPFNREE